MERDGSHRLFAAASACASTPNRRARFAIFSSCSCEAKVNVVKRNLVS